VTITLPSGIATGPSGNLRPLVISVIAGFVMAAVFHRLDPAVDCAIL